MRSPVQISPKSNFKSGGKPVIMSISTLVKKVSMAATGAVVVTLGTISVASNASAITFTGSGGSIPDSNGSTPGVFSSNINVSNNFTVGDVTVTLNNLTHTWVGDLIATLTNLNTGTSVTLFNRVGSTTPSGVGDSSNLGGTYSFNNSFTGNLWTTAAALNSTQVIPSGNYFSTTVGGAVSPLSAFAGGSSSGTWRLRITDNSSLDTGSLGSWSLNLAQAQSVPEPASVLGLLAVGALGATSRLKRKQQQEG